MIIYSLAEFKLSIEKNVECGAESFKCRKCEGEEMCVLWIKWIRHTYMVVGALLSKRAWNWHTQVKIHWMILLFCFQEHSDDNLSYSIKTRNGTYLLTLKKNKYVTECSRISFHVWMWLHAAKYCYTEEITLRADCHNHKICCVVSLLWCCLTSTR